MGKGDPWQRLEVRVLDDWRMEDVAIAQVDTARWRQNYYSSSPFRPGGQAVLRGQRDMVLEASRCQQGIHKD